MECAWSTSTIFIYSLKLDIAEVTGLEMQSNSPMFLSYIGENLSMELSSDHFYAKILSLSPVKFIFIHINVTDSRI